MSFSKSPTFNLKVVLQETDLPANTLRAWERRRGDVGELHERVDFAERQLARGQGDEHPRGRGR